MYIIRGGRLQHRVWIHHINIHDSDVKRWRCTSWFYRFKWMTGLRESPCHTTIECHSAFVPPNCLHMSLFVSLSRCSSPLFQRDFMTVTNVSLLHFLFSCFHLGTVFFFLLRDPLSYFTPLPHCSVLKPHPPTEHNATIVIAFFSSSSPITENAPVMLIAHKDTEHLPAGAPHQIISQRSGSQQCLSS